MPKPQKSIRGSIPISGGTITGSPQRALMIQHTWLLEQRDIKSGEFRIFTQRCTTCNLQTFQQISLRNAHLIQDLTVKAHNQLEAATDNCQQDCEEIQRDNIARFVHES